MNYASFNEIDTKPISKDNLNIPSFLLFSSDNENNIFGKISNKLEQNKNSNLIKSTFLSHDNIDFINHQLIKIIYEKTNKKVKLQDHDYIKKKAEYIIFPKYYSYLFDNVNEQVCKLNEYLLDSLVHESLNNLSKFLKHNRDLVNNNVANSLAFTIPENVNISGTQNINIQDRIFDLYK